MEIGSTRSVFKGSNEIGLGWIEYCRGWVWEKCFIGSVGATDQKCWRWDGFRRREGEFCLGGSGTCRARSGRRWGWVRGEEKGENPLARRGKRWCCSSVCGWTSDRRQRVGWSSVSLLLVRGVELKSLASRTVWSKEFRKCFEGKITPAIVFQV